MSASGGLATCLSSCDLARVRIRASPVLPHAQTSRTRFGVSPMPVHQFFLGQNRDVRRDDRTHHQWTPTRHRMPSRSQSWA